jgi:hypothetical protein
MSSFWLRRTVWTKAVTPIVRILYETGSVPLNVTLRRVRVTIVAVGEKNRTKYVLLRECICSLNYLSCKAHAPYCIVTCLSLPCFPHNLIKGTIYGNTLLNTKFVFWFSLQLLSETFLILRGTERDMVKIYFGLHLKYSLFVSGYNRKGKVTPLQARCGPEGG